MVKVSRWKNNWRVFLLLAATSSASPAQTFTTLFNFTAANGGYPDGVVPQSALIQGTDGNLYGTTTTTVFKLTTTGTLTTLYTFNASDGSAPYGALLQATDGNFYGTTTSGGASDDGTVFKITPAGEFTTLHSFDLSDGSTPAGALIQATDGNFYGTTSASASAKKSGSDKGNSTVFKITSTGALTTLYTFNNAAGDGSLAYGALVQAADGNLYGTTGGGGGDNSFGTVYSITPTGTLTYLHRFDNTEGTVPTAGLVHATDGNFYGTTSNGGDSGFGTVFKMTPAGAVTTLHSFNGIDGLAPLAALIQATDGNFYGTTFSCTVAVNCGGTVFQINAMGSLTTLHTFTTTDGAGSLAALFQASDGNLYGTTSGGGLGSAGTIFRISLSSGPAAVSFAPSITIGGIVPNTIQPGEEILIYGANLATGTEVSTGASSPSIAGTSVTIDGQAASLLFVSPGQIVLQVPDGTATGLVPVTVTTPSGSATSTVVLGQFAP